MTAASFNLAIDRFMRDVVPEKVAQLQRVITLQVLEGVVQRTPVDTGRARGNWQVSLEAPVLDLLEAMDKTGGSTIQAAVAQLGAIKPFSITYIQNNLPYISELERGTSTQAPNGMVAVTVVSVEAQFK